MSRQTVTRIVIRYAETDQMGVVHHSFYPVYFEAGRTDFFIEHIRPYHQLEGEGLLAPVTHYEVNIEGRASYGDVLLVRTRPDWLKGVRVRMAYELSLEGGALVATGSSTHALLGTGMKPVNPRKFGAIYQQLCEVFA
ncbi:MAG: acyl-CoA thioesterase [Vulcanimicrobiota bacterium]